MTVKSPFYNKPSTATSVDSCHKCPLDTITQNQDSSVVPIASSVKKVQPNAGFEYTQATELTSNSVITNTSNQQSSAVEPSSSSAAISDIGNVSVTSCSNCGTTTTPLWRRSPQGETICNACGLYLKARNTTRPPWLKRNCIKRPTPSTPVALAPAPPTSISITTTTPIAAVTTAANTATPTCISHISSSPQQQQQSIKDGEERPALSCANCNTTTTPLWRRDEQGNTICNACGLYYKLHSVHRPMTMKRSIIKRRKRVTVSSMAAQHHYSSASSDDDNSSGDDSSTTLQQQQQSVSLAPRKRKLMPNNDVHRNKRIELNGGGAKYVMRPLLPHQPIAPATIAENSRLDPVEPDAFHKHQHQQHLPSPPMKPIPRLLNPESRSLPSLHSLPSPPLTAKEMFKDQGASSSAVTTAAAMATVSALLNPTQKTHQMLEAHRHELQREVTNLTSLLSRTTAMLQNLDQVMAVTKDKQPTTINNTTTSSIQQQQPHVTNALMSLFALAAAKETSGSSS
ncbi:hypothetical protein K492DRAFT_158499 [Lichtheimia hyalospora FSU 10163]|nr:hypothetical protein K492DRAFT_158499 [Lichtheimia hyalospora FSU 10163]